MRLINSLVLFLFLSNSIHSQVKDDTVAKVNGEPIFLSEIEKIKSNFKEQYPDFGRLSSDELNRIALDKAIEEKLLKQEADKEKIKVFDWEVKNEIDNLKKRVAISEGISEINTSKIDAVFNEKLRQQNMSIEDLKENIKKKIMMEKVIDKNVKSKIKKPTDDELKKFFEDILKASKTGVQDNLSDEEKEFYSILAERLKEAFGERVRYRQILIKPNSYTEADKKRAYEKAVSIRERIINGEDFEDIAVRESSDFSAKNGGDMGYVVRGNLPENLEKVVFSLNPGQISEPIWTDFGYYIIQVVEKKIAEKPRFERIKPDLENILMQKRFAQEVDNYLKELKKRAAIEVYKK